MSSSASAPAYRQVPNYQFLGRIFPAFWDPWLSPFSALLLAIRLPIKPCYGRRDRFMLPVEGIWGSWICGGGDLALAFRNAVPPVGLLSALTLRDKNDFYEMEAG